MSNGGVVSAFFRFDTRDAENSVKRFDGFLSGKLTQSLGGLTGRAGMAGRSLSGLGPAGIAAAAGIGAVTIGAVAAVAAVTKLVSTGLQYAEGARKMADNLDNLSQRTGLGVESLQLYSVAAERAGTSLEAVGNSANVLQRNIVNGSAEAARGAKLLGLSFEELRRMSPDDQLRLVLDRLKEIPNHTDRAAAAMLLMGRSGAQMLGVANNLEAVEERAERLGTVLSEKVVMASDRLDDSLADLNDALEGSKNQIGGAMSSSEAWRVTVDFLADSLGTLNKWLQQNQGQITSWVDEGVLFAVKGLLFLNESLLETADWLKVISRGAVASIEALAKLGVTGAAAMDALSNPLRAGVSGAGVAGEFAKIETSADSMREKVDAAFAVAQKSTDETRLKLQGLIEKIRQAQNGFHQAAESIRDTAGALDVVATQITKIDKLSGLRRAFFGGAESLPTSSGMPAEFLDPFQSGGLGMFGPGGGMPAGFLDDTIGGMKQIVSSSDQFERNIRLSADLIQALPSSIGRIVSGITSAAAGFQAITSSGGITGLFKEGFSKGGGGLGGVLGGIGAVAGPLGALASVGVSIVKGIASLFDSGPDFVRDASRDMGARITQDMADAIEESGRPLQLAIADIFKSGGFDTADRFAEEIGDIFSVLSRGEVGRPEAIAALEESVAALLPHLGELGEEGQAQIERIISAAREAGIEFEGLGALIQSTFAPKTIEEMAEQFGVTNDKIRELASLLEVEVQTNLERTAAGIGLTAAEFQALGAALETQMGIPAAQLVEFIESMGISAERLAEELGVNVGAGAQTVAEEQQQANDRLAEGESLARGMAEALERAARASRDIHIPDIGGIPGAQHGEIVTRPGLRHVAEGGTAEVIAPVRALFDSAMRIAAGGGSGSDPQLAAMIQDLPGRIERAVVGGMQRSLG